MSARIARPASRRPKTLLFCEREMAPSTLSGPPSSGRLVPYAAAPCGSQSRICRRSKYRRTKGQLRSCAPLQNSFYLITDFHRRLCQHPMRNAFQWASKRQSLNPFTFDAQAPAVISAPTIKMTTEFHTGRLEQSEHRECRRNANPTSCHPRVKAERATPAT